jgi:hypothetical protein
MPNAPANRDQEWPAPEGGSGHPSIRRRQLLRAAASAGPLIATLPSGAALAQASAVNCAVAEQEASVGDQPAPVQNVLIDDKRVRIAGEVRLYQSKTDPKDQPLVYYIPAGTIAPTEIFVYGDPAPNAGEWFDTTDYTIVPGSAQAVGFLVQYDASSYPVADASDIAVPTNPTDPALATKPGACQITNAPDWSDDREAGAPVDTPTSPDYCFHPFAVQVSPEQPGNIPLAYSCLCSIQPNNVVACTVTRI